MAKKAKKKVSSKKRSVGRPTEYRKEFCQKLIDHFTVKPYTKFKNKEKASDLPTISGFATSIGVHRDTLNEWKNTYPEFDQAYKVAKAFQENFILVNGSKGTINTTFAIFMLKNNHNYRDRHPDEVDKTVVNNNNSNEVSIHHEEIEERINQLKDK